MVLGIVGMGHSGYGAQWVWGIAGLGHGGYACGGAYSVDSLEAKTLFQPLTALPSQHIPTSLSLRYSSQPPSLRSVLNPQ